jgi:hypothetical protein
MSLPVEMPRQCGNCQLFKPRIGGIDPEYCRGPRGLLLGSREKTSACVKPESFLPLNATPDQSVGDCPSSAQIYPSQSE